MIKQKGGLKTKERRNMYDKTPAAERFQARGGVGQVLPRARLVVDWRDSDAGKGESGHRFVYAYQYFLRRRRRALFFFFSSSSFLEFSISLSLFPFTHRILLVSSFSLSLLRFSTLHLQSSLVPSRISYLSRLYIISFKVKPLTIIHSIKNAASSALYVWYIPIDFTKGLRQMASSSGFWMRCQSK